ncbi:SRPBCC family protein [Hoeflea sp.]|uniref:SRPBCC family protein n=1 Tax=Hoeflea sp. TaxID=1940281 RepID=UPI003B01287D
MGSRNDAPRPSLKVFVNAAPVAVFSVLSDMENRASFLSSVRRVIKVQPLPVEAGTSVREKRAIGTVFSRSFRIVEYRPPDYIAFSQRWLGLPIRLEITLRDERGGTLVTAHVASYPMAALRPIVRLIAAHWLRQWENDLSDIKRHVEPRANPAWREKLQDRQSSGPSGGSRRPSK